jgi:hypothetical protein
MIILINNNMIIIIMLDILINYPLLNLLYPLKILAKCLVFICGINYIILYSHNSKKSSVIIYISKLAKLLNILQSPTRLTYST